jgi:hypothetical protein
MTSLAASLAALALAACVTAADPAGVARREIEAVIAASVEATRAKDAAAFLALVPSDVVIETDTGQLTTRADLEAAMQRRGQAWPTTVALSIVIERFTLRGAGDAEVWTLQRWERIPYGQPDVRVLTTQRHQEFWRRGADGRWGAHRIRELGGERWVNGVKQPAPTR